MISEGDIIRNQTDKWGNSAIHNVILGREKVLREQFKDLRKEDDMKFNIAKSSGHDMKRVDSHTCIIDHNKCMDILLKNNHSMLFDIDEVNLVGNTALHLAVKLKIYNDITLAKMLIEKKARIDIKDKKGKVAQIHRMDEDNRCNSKNTFDVKRNLIEPYPMREENHELFLKAVEERNLQKVESLLENNSINLNDYVNSLNGTPLTFAFRNGFYQIANCLVKNIIEKTITMTEEVLSHLLDEVLEGIIEYKVDTERKHNQKNKRKFSDYGRCMEKLLANKGYFNIDIDVHNIFYKACQHGFSGLIPILLQYGADPSRLVTKMKTTPLLIAFGKGYYEVAEILIKHVSKKDKTEEWFKKLYGVILQGKIELSKCKKKRKCKQKKSYEEVNYGKCLDILLKDDNDNHPSSITGDMLYKTYDNNLTSFAKLLLANGSDPSYMFENNDEHNPILIVSKHGNYRIMESLLKKGKESNILTKVLTETNKWKNNALLNVIKSCKYTKINNLNDNRIIDDVDSYKCIEILLRYKSYFSIDAKDKSGNTALHYALQIRNDNSYAKILIKHGALIDVANKKGQNSMSNIRCSLLKSVLDDCIEGDVDNDDMETTMNLSMLSHNESLDIKTETDLVKEIYSKNSYNTLLFHPIIIIFLYIKWQKLKLFWVLNLAFYIISFVCTMIYIILFQFVTSPHNVFWETILIYLISLLGIIAAIKELIQMYMLKFKYFISFDNYLEVFVLIMKGIVLYYPDYDVQQTCSAWLVVGIVAKAILLVGRTPHLGMSIYIKMFKTVMSNFVKVTIFLYFWLILSFSFAFLILSKDTLQPDIFISLKDYLSLIMGIIVMSTGEMEYSDLSAGDMKHSLTFNISPISSHLLFFLFVFIVVLVTMNLINGIAISDIYKIREQAECHEIREQAEYIIAADETLKILIKVFSCCQLKYKFWNHYLVFDSCYPNKEVTFFPKRRYKVIWSHCKGHACSNTNFHTCPKCIKNNFADWIKISTLSDDYAKKCHPCNIYMSKYYYDKHMCSKTYECYFCHTSKYIRDDTFKKVHQCHHRHKYFISSMTIHSAMNVLQKKKNEKREQETLRKISLELENILKKIQSS
ncbi:unnamed protein product, partial [Meganyctiphanes norvegica]